MSKVIRCKFKCDTASPQASDETYDAHFSVVIEGSKENEEFFKYTPAGSLSLGVMGKQHFEPGKEYYLDITPCEE